MSQVCPVACFCRAEGPKAERAKHGQAGMALKPRASLQARSTGGTPVRGTFWRRRQVSWLAGHRGGSGLPEPCAKLSDTKWNRHSPLTVAGAAPDFAQRTSPASRLSPAVMPEAGNLDRLLKHHRETSVKCDIKISLYVYKFMIVGDRSPLSAFRGLACLIARSAA